MTRAECDSYREQLVALTKRLRTEMSGLGNEAFKPSASDLSNLPTHAADLCDNFEHEVTIALLEKERATLAETADALARLDGGTFGRCEECRAEISSARLQALPYARLCIACARQSERS
jgi:DnaK suppressor protein